MARTPEVLDFIRGLGLDPSLTRHIIVDIPVDGAITVYVEQNAAIEAFRVKQPLTGESIVVETAGILECHHSPLCTSVDACWTKGREG